MNRMYAIVGMCGSGKSVVCDYLESLGYNKIYFGGVTMQELEKAGLAVTPENEKKMRESLRKKYGMGAFASLLLAQIEASFEQGNVVLDGLYSWDEYVILKEKFGQSLEILAIVADKEIRYERLASREVRPLSREEAEKRDMAEIENLAKGGPIAFADYYLLNNGERKELEKNLEKILRRK